MKYNKKKEKTKKLKKETKNRSYKKENVRQIKNVKK